MNVRIGHCQFITLNTKQPFRIGKRHRYTVYKMFFYPKLFCEINQGFNTDRLFGCFSKSHGSLLCFTLREKFLSSLKGLLVVPRGTRGLLTPGLEDKEVINV